MAFKNLVTVLLITNLIIIQIVVETRSYNDDVTDDFYKTYYVNKYNRNYRDDQEEEKMAKKLAKHIAVEITNELHTYAEQSRSEDDEKVKLSPRFIFPDNEQLQTRYGDDENRGVIIPANCGSHTFCENVSNYPQNLMDLLILNNSTLRHLATHDVMPIETRAFTEDDPLCASEERLIRPKSARNVKNETLFIIQSSATDFVQAVRIEICLNESDNCKLIDAPLGYSMTCQQKYVYRELSAVSKTGEVIRDHFKLPASCCCHSKFDPQIVSQQLRDSFRTRSNM